MSASSASSPADKPQLEEEDIDVTEDEVEKETPLNALLDVSTRVFLCSSNVITEQAQIDEMKRDILRQVESNNMSAYYSYLHATHGWPLDAATLQRMTAANEKELNAINEKLKEAEQIAGDTEVRECLLQRAQLYNSWGDQSNSYKYYSEVYDKTIGVASKIDVLLAEARVALAFQDLKTYQKDIEKAKVLVDEGGDWERKNQLQVYESILFLITRQFSCASKLLLDSIATYTTTELFPYTTFVLYTCVLAIIVVDRSTLKAKVLNSPEILSVLDQIPNLRSLLFSFYKCNYAEFFRALSAITPQLLQSRYLHAHVAYYLRELRVVGYKQFLASYKAASLDAMAQAFGISKSFLETELFRFISTGRISAKIDQVNGVIENIRADKKNQQYEKIIKQGDALLNRLQKLSKVVAL